MRRQFEVFIDRFAVVCNQKAPDKRFLTKMQKTLEVPVFAFTTSTARDAGDVDVMKDAGDGEKDDAVDVEKLDAGDGKNDAGDGEKQDGGREKDDVIDVEKLDAGGEKNDEDDGEKLDAGGEKNDEDDGEKKDAGGEKNDAGDGEKQDGGHEKDDTVDVEKLDAGGDTNDADDGEKKENDEEKKNNQEHDKGDGGNKAATVDPKEGEFEFKDTETEASKKKLCDAAEAKKKKKEETAKAKQKKLDEATDEKIRKRRAAADKKKNQKATLNKRQKQLPTRGKKRNEPSDSDDSDDAADSIDSGVDLNDYYCANHSYCLLGMHQKIRKGDTKCYQRGQEMHIYCGSKYVPITKKGKAMKKPPKNCRICYYCGADGEVLDEDIVLPPSQGSGVASASIAQKRCEQLAGKKGLQHMIAARGKSDGTPLVITKTDEERYHAFVDATFRRWRWKTRAQFTKWAKDMKAIIKELKAEYNAN
jgi:hypothetical protein